MKEEQIELKLKSVAEEWAAEVFTFVEHKSRGPVVLKVGGRRNDDEMALVLCITGEPVKCNPPCLISVHLRAPC